MRNTLSTEKIAKLRAWAWSDFHAKRERKFPKPEGQSARVYRAEMERLRWVAEEVGGAEVPAATVALPLKVEPAPGGEGGEVQP